MPEVTFPAVSQHLRRLRDAGLVTTRAEGRHRYYRADKQALGPLAAALEAMWETQLDALTRLAEQEEGR
jgi:DNA-binding transcriptional ArsR family regulator